MSSPISSRASAHEMRFLTFSGGMKFIGRQTEIHNYAISWVSCEDDAYHYQEQNFMWLEFCQQDTKKQVYALGLSIRA